MQVCNIGQCESKNIRDISFNKDQSSSVQQDRICPSMTNHLWLSSKAQSKFSMEQANDQLATQQVKYVVNRREKNKSKPSSLLLVQKTKSAERRKSFGHAIQNV
jgi:hypothetical protein